MYLNRSKNGFGWYSNIKTKDAGGNELSHYLQVSFKKGCEPTDSELTNGAYEGELYFIDKQGHKRKVFPIVKEYNGLKYFEFKLLESDAPKESKMFGGENRVEPEELPFY